MEVWVKGRPVGELLHDLSKQTGVRLAADPAVADQKVTVFAKGMEMADLRKAISRLFDYQWLPGGRASTYDYKLFEGRNRARRAETLRDLPAVVAEAEMERELSDWLRLGPPADFLAGMPSADRAHLAGEFQGRARVLSLLSPEQRRSLFHGAWLRFAVRDVGGELGAALEGFQKEYAMPERAGGTPERRESARVEFYSESHQPAMASATEGADLTFMISTEDGGSASGYNMAVPRARYEAALKRRMDALRAGERQSEQEKAAAAPPGQLEAKLAIAGKEKPAAAPADEAEEKPAATGKPEDPGTHFADVLEEIAEAAGVNIVADYHTKPPKPIGSLSGLPLREALDKVAATFGPYWNTTGDAYLFRSDRWWEDDAAEIPERAIRRWKETLAAGGYLPLATLAEIAGLSDAQLGTLALALPEARVAGRPRRGMGEGPTDDYGTPLEFLRFYASLDPKARAGAESAEGLSCRSLPRPLFELLEHITRGRAPYSYHGPSTGSEALADCCFSVSTQMSEAEYVCALRLRRERGDAWAHTLKQPMRREEPKPAAKETAQ